nr:DUF4199 domain-containing protein [Bacteroidota bacterium]
MEKKSSFSVAITNGIYIGVVLILYSLALFVLDVARDHWLQYFSFLIMIVGVYIAVKNFRDNHTDGYLTYGQAFGNGFLTLLFASILGAIYTFIFFQFIAPGEVAKMLEIAEEQIYESNPNISDAEFEMAWKWASMMMKPWMMAIWGLLGSVIGGLIISAIVSIFVKKEQQQFG